LGVLLLCVALPALGAFESTAFADGWNLFAKKAKAPCNTCKSQAKAPCNNCANKAKSETAMAAPDLPPNAEPGECYAKAYIPAEYKTVSERQMVRDASERIEIIPAEFKWVEERVLIKEASTKLEEVPAQYKTVAKTIEVAPAHTGWVIQKAADCGPAAKETGGNVYCLKTTPAQYKTIKTECLVKPACVREVCVPAEYQTIRRQVVAAPAAVKKTCIPAEYEDVQRTVLVCPERIKWEHIVCEQKLTSDTVNRLKSALAVSGYKPGPLNGQLGQADWTALAAFQQKSGLGVGQLSYDTLKRLGVSVD
jgi:hypothetical protein